MKSWAANRTKQLCWGLALLALAQPVLSLDCPCVCDSYRIPAGDEIPASHGHDGDASCCHHGHADSVSNDSCRDSTSLTVLALVQFHDCQCPRDCHCHWRHADGQAVVISPKTSNNAWRLKASLSDGLYVIRALLSHELPGKLCEQERLPAVSAQSACAVLCRFLS